MLAWEISLVRSNRMCVRVHACAQLSIEGIGIWFPSEELCGNLAEVPFWKSQLKSHSNLRNVFLISFICERYLLLEWLVRENLRGTETQ